MICPVKLNSCSAPLRYTAIGCALVGAVYYPALAAVIGGTWAFVKWASSRKAPLPFPFFVKTLPSVKDEAAWMKETGLTRHEVERIDYFVQRHLGNWGKINPGEVLRVSKEESNLPRSIHVFREYDRVCVQVLCKTKGQLKEIGSGAVKKAKVSVEWLTKTMWVQYVVISSYHWNMIEKGLAAHDLVAGRVGVFPKLVGRMIYEQKGGSEKFSFFGPLRDGIFDRSLFKKHPNQKWSMMHESLQGLNALEEMNVTHLDIKEDNILFYRDDRGKYHLELADFDIARISSFDLANLRENPHRIHAYDRTSCYDIECLKAYLGFQHNLPSLSARQLLAQFEKTYSLVKK